jgi:anti-anti-sigma factor
MTAYAMERLGLECRVVLNGDFTSPIVADLQGSLKRELDNGCRTVVFDLSSTTMVDSSGIGLLIATANSLNRNKGDMRVVKVSEDVLQLFRHMRLADRLHASGR